jgi:ABC-type antimicrobial peptide transport system permease subunit
VVRGLSSAAILSPVTTLQQQLSEQLSPRRFQTWLLGLFSGVALVLAGVGIYALLHYSVAARTHEMGIRRALGAQSRDIVSLVIGEGVKLVLLGIAIGVVGAINLTSLMATLLFGVTPTDPLAFSGVVVLLTLVGLAACYVPARRAMQVDPAVSLKNE